MKLYNKIYHLDEYPRNSEVYKRYYLLMEKDEKCILETDNRLAKLNIFMNFYDADEIN